MVVELVGASRLEPSDVAPLDPYMTARAADFQIELTSREPDTCKGLRRDSSALSHDGLMLSLRYASWTAVVDLPQRTARAHLPRPDVFDNFLRTFAQIAPLVTGLGVAVHAASLSLGGRAIALAAPSNTGKSTAAVRALAAGAGLLAEDVTLIGISAGRATVHTSPLRNHCEVVAGPQSVPLDRVYGLRRASHDAVVRLTPRDAMKVLEQNVAIGTRQLPLVLEALRCANILSDNVGVRRLDCTLNGSFWETVGRDLANDSIDVTEAV